MNNKAGYFLSALILIGAALFLYMNNMPGSSPRVTVTEQPAAAEPPQKRHQVIRDLPAPGAIPPSAEPTTPAEPKVEIIPPPKQLNCSDDIARFAAEALSKKLITWLTPEEQLRKWVLLVENLANNEISIKNRPLTFSAAPLALISKNETLTLAPNEQRAEVLVTALTSIDTSLLGHYYRAWSPVLEQAYAELGQKDSFHTRLMIAMDNVMAVDAQAAEGAKLIQPSVFYKFADPKLEKATELEKFFWRLGAKNTEKVQAYLKQLKPELTL